MFVSCLIILSRWVVAQIDIQGTSIIEYEGCTYMTSGLHPLHNPYYALHYITAM